MNLGETQAAKRARLFLTTAADTVWSGPVAKSLFVTGSERWLVHSRCKGAWKRTLRWISEFEIFAKAMCAESRRTFRWTSCLADNVLCYLFLVQVANEDKGSTRPVAARRALNRQRKQTKLLSLNDDPRVSALIAGVKNSRPKVKRQMESLDVSDVDAVLEKWGASDLWWKVMVSVMAALGFLTLMRCGEMVRLLRQGVILVLRVGREVNLRTCKVLPTVEQCNGMLVLVVWRKSKQAANAWLPMSCPRTMALMLAHERFLRSINSTSKYCFPSRRKTGKNAFGFPNVTNHMSTSSFVGLLKQALRLVCGVDPEELRLYGGHSLRVGGSNFMRWLGIHEDVHKALGGWAHLVSAKEYMQRSPAEQFIMTRALAVKKKRDVAIEDKRDAMSLLNSFQSLKL